MPRKSFRLVRSEFQFENHKEDVSDLETYLTVIFFFHIHSALPYEF